MEEKRQRNCGIDCLRFVYAWMVAGHHYYASYANGEVRRFSSAYIAVEMFLLIASVFFFQSFERAEQRSAEKYGGGITFARTALY